MLLEFAGGCQHRAELVASGARPSLGERLMYGPTWLPELLMPTQLAGPARVAPPPGANTEPLQSMSAGALTRADVPPALRPVSVARRSPAVGAPAADHRLPAADRVLPAAWEPSTAPRPWRYLVLHHSASEHGDVESIDAAHRQRTDRAGQPWLGIGYHFVVGNGQGMADGLVEPTFRWREQLHGAHAGDREHNEQGIGICLVGDFDRVPPTERQLAATTALVTALADRFQIKRSEILRHRELKETACPGRLFELDGVLGQLPFEPTAASAVPQMDLPAQLPAASVR
ncbi:MAG: N-acetylmuramoyl-L-alanine amidase [Pirellulales bacterium]|nr:N-acetylmuramoyl-L-alanine amidase [Pirellulales bacterium]